jgi:S1-C subfamily serine protease
LSAQRNTGAYVTLVYEKSAAFYANLAKGDIIIEINGIEILDANSVHNATLFLTSGSPVTIKYLRYGRENTASFNIY